MAVKAELVREHLVGPLLDEAESRYPGDLPPAVADALDSALEQVAGAERATAAPAEAPELAARLARLGYLVRIVEVERFEPARAPIPWLAGLVKEKDAGGDGVGPAVAVARDLAAAEPEERPEPGGDTPSWRIPGPGGHVRHYAALDTIARHAPRDGDGNPRLGEGIRSATDLKRVWMFGFFLRCCEEVSP